MLKLKPNCEHSNRVLPADSTEAMICSFECTFCSTCVQQILENVCPNCGGGFSARPIRPQNNLKNGNCLTHYPASNQSVLKPVDIPKHRAFAAAVKHLPPELR